MIKYNYEVSVNENRAKLNKDIFLFRGNRNIHYYFSIKGARFAFEKEGDLIEKTNAINAAVTVIKPNNVEVASAIAKVENGKIHLKVTEDLIDEEVEVGDFDLVFDLFDDTDGAVTIPKVIGQFHVLERPCTTPISELVATNTTNEVDQALTDYAIVTYAEPVASTNADGTFAKKTWVAKEKITTAELNRMEEGISDVSSQCKDIANYSLAIGTDGLLYIKKQDGTLIGTGVKISGDADLSKVTMSMSGQTLKLMNDSTQITSVEIPTAVVSDTQINNAVNSYLQNNPITLDDMWTDVIEGEIYEVKAPPKQIDISVQFIQGSTTVYADSTLDSLKSMLIVNKVFDDESVEKTNDYTLSGTLTVGTSVITVTSGTYTKTFNVIVSEKPKATLTGITAVYTQGDKIVYPSTSLDDLKTNLVVTASYSDSTTVTVSDYTLSGTLTIGTSTITATYQGKTATFTVTVTKESGYVTQNLAGYYDLTKYENGYVGDINDLSGNNMPMKFCTVNTSGVESEYNPLKTDRVGFVGGKFMCNKYYNGTNTASVYFCGLKIPNNSVFTTYPFTVEMYVHPRLSYKPNGDSLILESGNNTYTSTYQGVLLNTQNMPKDGSGNGYYINAINNKIEIKGNTNVPQISATDLTDFVIDGNTDVGLKNKYYHLIISFGEKQQVMYLDGVKVLDNTGNTKSISSSTRDMVFCSSVSGIKLFGDFKLIRVYKNKIFTENEASRNYNDVLDTMGGNN